MLRTAPLFVLVLATPTLLACGALSRDAPEKRAYVVHADRPQPTPIDLSSEAHSSTLEIRRFRISPRYDGRGFVYRRGAHVYEADFYNEFFAPPAELFTEAVRQWLAASGRYAHVVGPESRLLGAHVLEGNISALYGDFSGGAERAVLEIQFFLLAEPGSTVLLDRTERAEVLLEGSGPAALVEGWSRGLAEVLGRLELALPGPSAPGAPADDA